MNNVFVCYKLGCFVPFVVDSLQWSVEDDIQFVGFLLTVLLGGLSGRIIVSAFWV